MKSRLPGPEGKRNCRNSGMGRRRQATATSAPGTIEKATENSAAAEA